MITPDVLDLLERFQTTIVGVVGFLGVIWTLSANARHSRAEHSRQLSTRQATLRRILVAEFRNYSLGLKQNLDAAPPEGELFSVGKVRRLLSDSLTADLGLLEPDEIDIVVNALISLDGFDHHLENLCQHSLETRFLISPDALPQFREAAERMATALELAVEALHLHGER
ncbi:hypothetical protein [Sedimentimonas flavescens]|uniref:hypothetical protein n=1 Tax=Sedimentimonas flavescens TaxID=2851012 RepID=UPI0021A3EF9E|nr:hypothetical protein [Sedimentimonas flavescens]MCT2541232.1 hypothetical protein [Sedimentimonas flavescens]